MIDENHPFSNFPPKLGKPFENSIPLGRYADPIEIGQLVQFLASDESKFITGTTQVIDGGMNA